MKISELREMDKFEFTLYMVKAKIKDLKEVLKCSGYKGYSKLNKSDLILTVSQLVCNIISDLTDKVSKKEKSKNKKKSKQEDVHEGQIHIEDIINNSEEYLEEKESTEEIEEVKMYSELIENKVWHTGKNKYVYYSYFIHNCGEKIKDTLKEATKKYKRLVKYYHPDKLTGESDKFILIKEAFDEAKEVINGIMDVEEKINKDKSYTPF